MTDHGGMNLYLRLFWTLLRARFMARLGFTDTLVQRWRVLPNDVDVNIHMNNGRYLTMVDLALIEFFSRTGFLKSLVQQGWRPMAGGQVISYRRGLNPFQRYELRFRWLCSDERWNYMGFEFVRRGVLHAAGIMKGGAVGPDGLVPTAHYARTFPEQGRDALQQMLARPLTDDVIAWRESEIALMDRATQNVGAA
jgi:acyl-CoA thioesterase FadM